MKEPLPRWTRRLLFDEGEPLQGVRYLLTFRPFSELSPPLQRAYLTGELHLVALPGEPRLLGSATLLRLSSESSHLRCRSRCSISSDATRRQTASAFRSRAGSTRPHLRNAEPDPSHGPLRDEIYAYAPLGAGAASSR